MNPKASQNTSDEFELQPSVEAHQPREGGPAAPHAPHAPHAPGGHVNPVHEPADANAFDPQWAKPGKPHGRATPGHGHATIPLKRTTGANKIPLGGPPPLDGPPPSAKVDFENLPAFVEQRRLLRNIKIGAAAGFAVIVALTLYFVFRTSKSTVVPIVDELKKDTPGIEQLIEKK